MNYKIYILLGVLLTYSNLAIAGRHGIAREEAANIVNERFAQFYRDEANRKHQEDEAMQREILSAKELEAAMLRELEEKNKAGNNVTSADDLEKQVLQDLDSESELGSEQQTGTFESSASSPGSSSTTENLQSELDSAFANNSTEQGAMGFFKKMQTATSAQKAGYSKEAIQGLQSLPGSDRLAESFAKELATLSPEMAKKFLAEYNKSKAIGKANKQNNSITKNSKNSKADNATTDKSKNLINNSKTGFNKSTIDMSGINAASNKQNYLEQALAENRIFNSVTTYEFNSQHLYQIYTAPNKVTAIEFAPGEKLIGTPICGDSMNWKINAISSGTNQHKWYLTIQPVRAGLSTSLTIATNKGRLYLLELTSLEDNYMAFVRWQHAE